MISVTQFVGLNGEDKAQVSASAYDTAYFLSHPDRRFLLRPAFEGERETLTKDEPRAKAVLYIIVVHDGQEVRHYPFFAEPFIHTSEDEIARLFGVLDAAVNNGIHKMPGEQITALMGETIGRA